jgi:hypothetical protein
VLDSAAPQPHPQEDPNETRRTARADLRALLERLVGQPAVLHCVVLPESATEALTPDTGLGVSQLNELLLLLGFDRVTRSFFQYLVDGTLDYSDGSAIKSFDALEEGVNRFRQLGLLHYGNVKHAFKVFSRDEDLLQYAVERLRPVGADHFRTRNRPILDIRPIAAERTFYLGYLVERELAKRLEMNPEDAVAKQQERDRLEVVEIGKANQTAYLASDHLDVYVATSMRQRHEFLAVNKLTRAIFAHPDLASLNLRYFDPTQAYCKDRIDKGLSEALMLRRARCTIYLAQETDTLGKDSELASTLAQGKPVVAFVPSVDDTFTDCLLEDLRAVYPDQGPIELMLGQLQLFESSAAWTDACVRDWLQAPNRAQIEAVRARLHRAVVRHYDQRAENLQKAHPLAVQVHLETGVANGVLVVRTVDDCAALVRNIVTKNLEFRLTEESGAVVLREATSNSVFRIETGDLMLTNAFWNFYLAPVE